MAQLAFTPGFRVTDTNDDPLSGAKLYFYDAGTTDDRTVYQDDALSVAHAQPVVCGSDGLVPAIYVPTGNYRVKGFTSGDSPISGFDFDDISGPIDTSALTTTEAKPLRAITSKTSTETLASSLLGGIINGNPGGGSFTLTLPAASAGNGKQITIRNIGTTGAVTVDGGASTINGDDQRLLVNRWDSETYISDGADWHVDTRPPRFPMPQGRLSLVTGTPVPATNQASKTTVYYAYTEGDICPVKFGSIMLPVRMLSEPSLTLNSSNSPASTILDVFGFLDSGTFRIGSLAWSTSSAGSSSRGTGGGTPELEYFQGVLVNTNSMTLKNGASSYSVAAQEGTYLGSYYTDTTAGQVSCHIGYGQNRKWGVWNAYNRRPIAMRVGDSTSSWNYATASYRASNDDADNSAIVFFGLQEEFYDVECGQTVDTGVTTLANKFLGIGIDSTSTSTGFNGASQLSTNSITKGRIKAKHKGTPILGVSRITMLEHGGGANTTFSGGEDDMLMTIQYRG